MKINIRVFLSVILLVTGFCAAVAQGTDGHRDMNVVLLGDSNTWIGGEECDNPRGWNKWFRDVFAPATCRSYARSGATWTNTERTVCDTEDYTELLGDNNVIYNQINRLADTVGEGRQAVPDLIVIAAGTNDAWFQKARPRVFAKTVDEAFAGHNQTNGGTSQSITERPVSGILTLAESVRYGCELLVEAFPEAHIVLLTPLQSTAVCTEDIRRAGDVIEGVGRRMGLCVIRQDGDDFVSRKQEARRKRMTTDGTHTSEAGARHNGTRIAQMIMQCTMYDEQCAAFNLQFSTFQSSIR